MLNPKQMEWRCRRGTRELDLLLQAYLEREFCHATSAEQRTFQQLLSRQNTELLDLLLGRANPDDCLEAQVVRKIRRCVVHHP